MTSSKNLGVPYNLVLFAGLTIAAMITASIVVVVGSISYIGLIVPNVVAMYKGDKIRGTLVDTALFGALFVLVCDMIGRVIIFPYELPIELIVGILGSLIFIGLLFYRLKYGRKAIRLGSAGTSCCSAMPNLNRRCGSVNSAAIRSNRRKLLVLARHCSSLRRGLHAGGGEFLQSQAVCLCHEDPHPQAGRHADHGVFHRWGLPGVPVYHQQHHRHPPACWE